MKPKIPRIGHGNEVLTIRIKNFTKDKDEPAIDVEFYQHGEFMKTYDGVISTKGDKKPFDATWNKAIEYTIKKLSELYEK